MKEKATPLIVYQTDITEGLRAINYLLSLDSRVSFLQFYFYSNYFNSLF